MSLPVITEQPASLTLPVTSTAVFHYQAASDQGGIVAQWLKNGVPLQNVATTPYGGSISGVNSAALTLTGIDFTSAGTYSVRLRNNASGHVDSAGAQLTIGSDLPVITLQPASVTAAAGTPATFTVGAEAANPGGNLFFQWYFRDVAGTGPIPGATTSSYTLPSVTTAAAGDYFCHVSNTGAGWGVGSAFATLTVTPAPAGSTDGPGAATPAPPSPGGGPVFVGDGGTVTQPTDTGTLPGLGAPVFSGAASAFASMFAETFGTEGVHYDGDWTTARPDGMGWPSFPFAGEGDQSTVVVKRRYMQRAQYFTPAALGSACPWNSSLLLLDEDEFRIEAGGIVSWVRTYATLPATRNVYESFSFSFQYVIFGGTTPKLAETAFEVNSRVQCEYYHVRDRASYPTLLYPRYLQLADLSFFKRGQGDLHQVGQGGSFMVSSDAEILAEDSKERMWRYPFMERRSRYIAGPTQAFWGSSLNISTPPANP